MPGKSAHTPPVEDAAPGPSEESEDASLADRASRQRVHRDHADRGLIVEEDWLMEFLDVGHGDHFQPHFVWLGWIVPLT